MRNTIDETNKIIRNLDGDLKIILDMFCNYDLENNKDKIEDLENQNTLKSVFSAYENLYKTIITSLDQSIYNSLKIISLETFGFMYFLDLLFV